MRLEVQDISRLALWERARLGVGYIPQSPSVLWDLTVEQNLVTFHQIVRGRPPPSVEDVAARVEEPARGSR